jgi:mono/diheme cytochrome c family protein
MNPRGFLLTAAATLLVSTIGVKAAGVPAHPASSQSAPTIQRSGEQIYRAACAACHGPDGRGNPRTQVGFDTPLPDFTDCEFATPEAEADWFAIVRNGGPVRAFARRMPAFGGALADDEILRVVGYLRGMCGDRRWPPGDLNLPRALLTEKAYPENEALFVVSASRSDGASVSPAVVYERRLGARSQWEVVLPVSLQHGDGDAAWTRGIGDLAFAFKHVVFHDGGRGSIVSLGGELALPTGRRSTGAGNGTLVFEPFLSAGQAIGGNGFLQAHAGIELPGDTAKAAREAFLRLALGRTFFEGGFHREWSPIVELIAARPIESGARAEWDVVPQLQVSLSRRHHVLVNAGVQLPIANREGRGRSFHAYLLWDWFDGGFFSGW